MYQARDKSDARHLDPKAKLLLIKVYTRELLLRVFIVAVFIILFFY